MELQSDENKDVDELNESKFQSFVQEAPELFSLINGLTTSLKDPVAVSQIERITTIVNSSSATHLITLV